MVGHKKIFIFCFIFISIFFIVSCSPKPKVIWENYKSGQLEEAKSARLPTVIDFYADWCISCHELENYTYTNTGVIQSLEGFKRVKVDLTKQNDPETMKLAERFNIEGLPTIVFLNVDGKEVKEARIEGFVEPQELIKMTQAVLTSAPPKTK